MRLELFECVRMDGSGDANLLIAFLDPQDLSLALQADRAFRINVFQDDSELYGLPGGKGTVRFKEYPRAVEIPCDTFGGFKFHRQIAYVTRPTALLRIFQDITFGV